MGGGTCFDEKCSSKYLPGFFQQRERKIKTICCWFLKPESNRNVRNRSSGGPDSHEKTERAAANLDVHSPVSSALKVKCGASQSLSSVHEYQLQNDTPNPEKRCCHSNTGITADKALVTKGFPNQSNSEKNNWKEELWSFIFRNLPEQIFLTFIIIQFVYLIVFFSSTGWYSLWQMFAESIFLYAASWRLQSFLWVLTNGPSWLLSSDASEMYLSARILPPPLAPWGSVLSTCPHSAIWKR